MKKFLRKLPNKFVVPIFLVSGIMVGLLGYTGYIFRVPSYFSSNPDSCVNCHIMASYYDSWRHSSHMRFSCNECHIPQSNILSAYMFKAKVGIYHTTVFASHKESQAIRPTKSSYAVIMENCIRCHNQLNTALVKTGMFTYADTMKGNGKACWDCHTQVPHTKVSNIAAPSVAIAPFPKSPIPEWIKKTLD